MVKESTLEAHESGADADTSGLEMRVPHEQRAELLTLLFCSCKSANHIVRVANVKFRNVTDGGSVSADYVCH